MALDGIVLSNIVSELSDLLIGARIDKVAQPEKDEIILSIRHNRTGYKLLLSAQANFPRLHLTTLQKTNPLIAPSFCMLLRKYLSGAKIIGIHQPNFERIVEISVEHLNELGDLCEKKLIIEIMGRHSNIILCDDEQVVLDSIKHVSSQMSSVREVFPGKEYFLPPSKDKSNILDIKDFSDFKKFISKATDLVHAIYSSFNGISPLIAKELCSLAQIDPNLVANELDDVELMSLYEELQKIVSHIQNREYSPNVIIDSNGDYKDFYSFPLSIYKDKTLKSYESISELLDDYFEIRSNSSRISQKSSDIRRLVQNNYDRCLKKYQLQLLQLKDTEDRDKFKLKGELINANLYQIKEGDEKVDLYNYYEDKQEQITLDPNLTPTQNAQKYYAKYNKKKRTNIALQDQIVKTKSELNHLESIKYALELTSSEEEMIQIKNELVQSGYIKFKKSRAKKVLGKSEPIHYISTDGFDIYVGRNNLQNDELSLKFARGNDWWFHAKDIPGSHVIVKTNNRELTDQTFEEAASIAAYYSKAKDSEKVTVDYTLKKNLRKPNGSAPGYVIYHTNFSILVEPSLHNLTKVSNQ